MRERNRVTKCRAVCLCVLASMLSLAEEARTEDTCQDPAVVLRVEHHGQEGRKIRTVLLSESQPFRICIENTDPSRFDYLLYGVVPLKEPPPQLKATDGTTLQLSASLLPPKESPARVHSATFRGYVLEIAQKAGAPPVPATCLSQGGNPQTPCNLKDLTVVLEVPESSWEVEGGGAFTVSTLTDPKFYLVPQGQANRVQEDTEARDQAKLGIAAFAHLHHRRFPKWDILSFGLGVNDAGRTSYFFGTGLRLGGKVTVLGGAVLGQVDRLPTGVNTTDPVSDANVLSSLGRRTAWGGFFAVTFSFVGNALDELKKPFAPPPSPPPPSN